MPRGLRLVLLATLAGACGPAAPPGDVTPLLDGAHAPLVLTESSELEGPPAYSGNRFLTGWRMWERKGWRFNDGERSLLQAVWLEQRERRLGLSLELDESAPEGGLVVRIEGRELAPRPLAPELELPLPAGLGLGRVPIELDFGGAALAVKRAWLDDVLRPGRVEFEGESILQGGTSVIDLPRRLTSPTTLVGRFEPPRSPGPDQRFALLVDTEAGTSETAFEWRPGALARLLGQRRLSVPLPAGTVRVRLLARGTGGPGRWHGLGLADGTPLPPAPAPPPEPPKLVILYVMDALRADALGHLGGDPEASPVLDRLAAEGITFDRFYTVSPDTVASTKALLAGIQLLSPEARSARLDPAIETLGALFSAAGYRTGLFTGNDNAVAYGAGEGFEHRDRGSRFEPSPVNTNAETVHAAFLAWLEGIDANEPVLAYLHTVHPHAPYEPPAEFQQRFTAGIASTIDGSSDTLADVHHRRREVSEADRRRLEALYRANLAYNDHHLGLLLEELAERYDPGEVLLLITADHGEELFDHGGVLHGYTLYEEQLNIPLILWWPGQLEPRRVERLADNLDLNASLRALVGAGPGRGGGDSLWPAILGGDPGPGDGIHFAAAAGVKGGLYMAASERYKLILAPRGGMGVGGGRTREPEYLFDLEADPAETRNLAGLRSVEVDWLRSRLDAWIERSRLEEAGGDPAELDEETRERLKALGYLD